MIDTFPPPDPGRHGIAELLALVTEIRRLAFGTLGHPSRRSAESATRSASTTAPEPPHDTTARTLRGDADLLAEGAGLMAGMWSVRIGTGDYAIAAGLLVTAGADHAQIGRWIKVGRERALTPRHSI